MNYLGIAIAHRAGGWRVTSLLCPRACLAYSPVRRLEVHKLNLDCSIRYPEERVEARNVESSSKSHLLSSFVSPSLCLNLQTPMTGPEKGALHCPNLYESAHPHISKLETCLALSLRLWFAACLNY